MRRDWLRRADEKCAFSRYQDGANLYGLVSRGDGFSGEGGGLGSSSPHFSLTAL